MHEAIRERLVLPGSTAQDVLTGILRQGAQRMLAQAIDAEQVKQFAYLTERGPEQARVDEARPDAGRAAEGTDPAQDILFLED